MTIRSFQQLFLLLALALMAAAVGGCMAGPPGCRDAETPAPNDDLDKLLTAQGSHAFRCLPYLQLAAALQAMPRETAEDRLRAWSCSGQHELPVRILCHMLFVGVQDEPLAENQPAYLLFQSKYGRSAVSNHFTALGGTYISSWPNWPITVVNGVPFFIYARGPISGPYPAPAYQPQAARYLDYCLQTGHWTTQRYQAVDLEARRQALNALLDSPAWVRGLRPDDVKFLTYQINDEAQPDEPKISPL